MNAEPFDTTTHGERLLLNIAWIKRLARVVRSNLFSFELVFTLFLFAGRYKAEPALQHLPVDLTALFWGLSVCTALGILWRRRWLVSRRAIHLTLLMVAFVGYASLSLLWSVGRFYAREKAFYLATLTLWSLVGATIIIAAERHRLMRFLVFLTLQAIAFALRAVLERWGATGPGLIRELGFNYLGLSRAISLGALVVLAYWLFAARRRMAKLAAAACLGFLAYALLILGGRGPLLATVAGVSVPLVAGVRFARPGVVAIRRHVLPLAVIGLIAIIVLAYLLSTGRMFLTLNRLRAVQNLAFDQSTAIRLQHYDSAISQWLSSPFVGHGIGAFPILRGIDDVRLYPHNIVLEILAELGLVGLALFLALVGYALSHVQIPQIREQHALRLLILMLFVNAIVNAMMSGDIPDNRIVFAMLGLMAYHGA